MLKTLKKTKMAGTVAENSNGKVVDLPEDSACTDMLAEGPFLRRLYIEQRRTERSRRRFVLMLLESSSLSGNGAKQDTVGRIVAALSKSTRETDVLGWFKEGTAIGTIFTEIGPEEGHSVAKALLTKFTTALAGSLTIEQFNQITLSFHVFPDDWGEQGNGRPTTSVLYSEAVMGGGPKKGTLMVKRAMDIVGSLGALIVFSPLFALIAIAVKMTSKGPVIFRQPRVGQHGRHFTFLKFRSMYTSNDPAVHQEFVTRMIKNGNGNGNGNGNSNGSGQQKGQQVFKLTNDPRVTPLGRFLRRTSLDELPQFLNVLRGEMSLVGPRPPVPYEFTSYDIWHKRRLLEVKPGITGLWQVAARSRVEFADMVRLDLRYAKSQSLWLDLKILLRTPAAVLSGDGAH